MIVKDSAYGGAYVRPVAGAYVRPIAGAYVRPMAGFGYVSPQERYGMIMPDAAYGAYGDDAPSGSWVDDLFKLGTAVATTVGTAITAGQPKPATGYPSAGNGMGFQVAQPNPQQNPVVVAKPAIDNNLLYIGGGIAALLVLSMAMKK